MAKQQKTLTLQCTEISEDRMEVTDEPTLGNRGDPLSRDRGQHSHHSRVLTQRRNRTPAVQLARHLASQRRFVMADKIKFECAEADIDTLEVSPDTNGATGEHQIWFRSRDGGSQASIYLDEDNVRKLFNWLGIWLHQH